MLRNSIALPNEPSASKNRSYRAASRTCIPGSDSRKSKTRLSGFCLSASSNKGCCAVLSNARHWRINNAAAPRSRRSSIRYSTANSASLSLISVLFCLLCSPILRLDQRRCPGLIASLRGTTRVAGAAALQLTLIPKGRLEL